MAIAFVQAETGSTGGSTSPLEIPFDGFTADGNLLIIAVCATGVTAPTFSVTDTSSNTYLSAKRVVFGTLALELFYCIGCTGSGDITTIKVNIAYSGDTLTTINACIAEYNPPIGGLIFLDQN